MEHCVVCGRLVLFTGTLNKQNECEDCEAERIENENEESTEDYEEQADVRKAGLNPYHRYIFN